jgi:hypothetical protein
VATPFVSRSGLIFDIQSSWTPVRTFEDLGMLLGLNKVYCLYSHLYLLLSRYPTPKVLFAEERVIKEG